MRSDMRAFQFLQERISCANPDRMSFADAVRTYRYIVFLQERMHCAN